MPAKKDFTGFSEEERAAMKERVKELKAETERQDGEAALLAKIADMPQPDKDKAERIHAIAKQVPGLFPKTWYGMPAYANKDGKAIFFFKAAAKFGARYATLGFNDVAHLDDGHMWPTEYALMEFGPAEEAKVAELIKKAAN